MKTHLIILTSLDELRAKKESLVQKFSDAGNLRKYGDDSVETHDDQVFFLKVITLNEYRTKLLQEIGRGYNRIDLSALNKELNSIENILRTYAFDEVVPPENEEKELTEEEPNKKMEEDHGVDITNTPVAQGLKDELDNIDDTKEEEEEEEEISDDDLNL